MDRTQSGRSRPGAQRVDPHRTERLLAAERRIGAVAHLLDDMVAIPGTRQRIGLDPIIGLVPFLGDIVSGLVAAWIVVEAARFKLPTIVLLRMIMYATVDFLVGLVPILGDLFDIGFKANTRNLALFHRYAVDPGASTASSWALVGGVVLVFAGIIWLGIVLIGQLIGFVLGGLGF